MSNLTISQILGFSVVAALVTTIGSLIALFLKEYIFSRSFELWKNRNALQQIYQKYREPIILTALELCHRLQGISGNYPVDFLDSELLGITEQPIKSNTTQDTYFRQYKLLSTVYRLCAFLGWLELYRYEVVFLDTGESSRNQRLISAIDNIRSDLADGQLNNAANWEDWKDFVIFREEQRAIGETMIVRSNGNTSIIGYGKFVEAMQNRNSAAEYHWLDIAACFFLDPVKEQDFRLIRYQRMIYHLISLIEVLDKRRITEDHKAWRHSHTEP